MRHELPEFIELGMLASPLAEQLAKSGIPKKDLEHLDKDSCGLTRLHIRGLLSDSEFDRARERLMKNVHQQIAKYNPAPKKRGKK